MDPHINERIQRMSAALGILIESDLSAVKPIYSNNGQTVDYIFQVDMSDAEMKNHLNTALGLIDSFRDHLKGWARRHKQNDKAVEPFLKASREYCIVMDLTNHDKHGPLKHGNGHSGLAPTIENVTSGLLFGGTGGVILTEDGVSDEAGNNVLCVHGSVIDKDGNSLGTTDAIINAAVRRCEEAIDHFRVLEFPM